AWRRTGPSSTSSPPPSVDHPAGQLELDHGQVRGLVLRALRLHELDLLEALTQGQAPQELRDVLVRAPGAADRALPIVLGELGQPQPVRIPRGVEGRERVLPAELLET